MLRGILEINSLNKCLDLQKEIENDLKKFLMIILNTKTAILPIWTHLVKVQNMMLFLIFQFGDNITLCRSDWSKEIKQEYNWINGISVAILTSEFVDWITDY